jgi:phosphoglucosamine mutase
MITASHNPPEYNGIKLYNPDTTAYNQAQQNQIERLVASQRFRLANWQSIGKAIQVYETRRYIEMITSAVKLRQRWRILLDPGNGATSQLAPEILRELGCKVATMNSQPDGHFPGRGSEPSEKILRPLGSMVRKLKADIGIAYDGDGDRMITIDERGHVLPPDQTFAAYAAHRIQHEKNKTVITHVEASMCVEEMVEKEGGKVFRTKVGDVSITEAIKKQEATFGGEPCGAWIHPSYHYCPDGILSSILFLQALEETGQKPSQFISKAPTYPMLRRSVTCPSQATQKVMEKAHNTLPENFRETKQQSKKDGIRLTFNEGWLLIRPSGTEPFIRITVEAKTRKRAESAMKKTVRLLNKLIREANQ